MALPESYQWTPANNRTKFPVVQSSQVNVLDKAVDAQRQNEQKLLVWGLCIAAVFLLIVIGGTIRFRRAMGQPADPNYQPPPR